MRNDQMLAYESYEGMPGRRLPSGSAATDRIHETATAVWPLTVLRSMFRSQVALTPEISSRHAESIALVTLARL